MLNFCEYMVVAITYGTPYLQAGEYSGSQGPGAKVLDNRETWRDKRHG